MFTGNQYVCEIMQFNRKYTEDLLDWKNNPDRKPLVLEGARQVGKTSLIKQFGQDYFEDLAYFNFEENQEIKEFFEQTKNVERIIEKLSLLHGRKIEPQKTLLFLDEIQECNEALNSLKYFDENAKEYAVICAGSLLGLSLGEDASFPVGKVEFLTIHPLTFLEFLETKEPELYDYLNNWDSKERIAEYFFDRCTFQLKQYMVSGGMPEAAEKLAETLSVPKTDKVLQRISKAYGMDFSKHTSKLDAIKINFIWNSLPSQLAKENKKFIFQTLKSGARARDYEFALEWLIRSGLVKKINRCTKPFLPLQAYDDVSAFKMYLFDVGVLRTVSSLDAITMLMKNDIFTEFKGALTENYILQSLITQFDTALRYWTSEGIAELDFILQYRNQIIPIEVKAGEGNQTKSLQAYNLKYEPRLRICYSLNNFNYDNGLLQIPVFLADKTKQLVDLYL